MRALLGLSAWLIYVFLLAPIVVIVGASFTAGNFIVFPPAGLSLRWYGTALSDPGFRDSLWLSLVEALIVAGLTLVLVIPAVIGTARRRFAGSAALVSFYQMPLTIPRVVLAAALLGFFGAIGLRGSLTALVLAHTIIACPLAFWILQAGFAEQSIQLERAAIVLGARPLKAFLSITLRLALPAVVAAGMFAFIAAFDDVPIALFLSSPTLVTLPVRIYNFVDQSLTPVVVAASSLLIFIVCAVVAVVDRTVGLARAFGVKEAR